jgi:hypothetical protein
LTVTVATGSDVVLPISRPEASVTSGGQSPSAKTTLDENSKAARAVTENTFIAARREKQRYEDRRDRKAKGG